MIFHLFAFTINIGDSFSRFSYFAHFPDNLSHVRQITVHFAGTHKQK